MILSSVSDWLVTNGENARLHLPMFKKAGFDAIDFSFYSIYKKMYEKDLTSEVFDLPHDEMIAYFKEIRDAADDCGIKIGQTHAPFPSQIRMDGYEQTNEYMMGILEKCVECTAVLRCKYMVTHPVFAKYDGTKSREEEWEDNIKFYSSFIPSLKKFGVVMCLENMWVRYKDKIYGAVCSDFDEVNRYIETLNSIAGEELFGFCFDCGHATICAQDVGRAIKTLGKNIKVLHLHEVDGVHDSHSMPFLNGVTDWDRLFNALHDIGYEGTINFEAAKILSLPYETLPETLALLGSIGRYFVKTYLE